MPEPLGEFQRRMLEFIVNYIRREGMPPTNREIGKAMKIASTGHVDYHLSMLEKRGYIVREAKKSRGIKLTRHPWGIPVEGTIAAGEPIEIFSEPDQTIEVGHGVDPESSFALVVRGQSMIEDHICDGDYVVIKRQRTCENGDIVVAVHLVEGIPGKATLKRFFLEKEQVRLQPANAELEPIYIPRDEWDREWEIQGKVIAIVRHYGGPGRAA
ncbi:transcriptional repressor LexA [Thermogemmatispora carboxidivorans]|uniref:transcriptional repressor LexA n=1 Tax=Thermogemmatispora carboxidivorans TaxID=1382306 RepID=UPI00069C036B|nr:transcriptional repressor LexA [Thermogemmatispora carboxidivorans]